MTPHVQRKSLTKLADANVYGLFTENKCTDILSMPDGGAIQTIKNKINNIVEETVDNDIDAWFGVTPASKSLRRKTLLSALGAAWNWFRIVHTKVPRKI